MIDSISTGSDGGGDTALGGRGARERRDAGLWYDANYDEGLAAARTSPSTTTTLARVMRQPARGSCAS